MTTRNAGAGSVSTYAWNACLSRMSRPFGAGYSTLALSVISDMLTAIPATSPMTTARVFQSMEVAV